MVTAAGTDLHALKEHPFDLLRELERRSKAALAGASGDDVSVEEWVGVGFRLGEDKFVVDRSEIREVLMLPSSVTRVPGARSWVKGLANVRGHVLSIVDLKAYLGSGAATGERTARVLVLNRKDFPIGLVVDEVFGFRRFLQRERSSDLPQTVVRCDRYLVGAYLRGGETWPIFSMANLLAGEEFHRAAED